MAYKFNSLSLKFGTARNVVSLPPPLLLMLLLSTQVAETVRAADDSAGNGERDAQQLLLRENYYTMHQDETHVTLKINVDGKIEWDEGTPTLYSVFREQIVRSSSGNSGGGSGGDAERTYTLEATATRYWICMTGKGQLYTLHQPQYHREQRRKLERLENGRIRHEPTKRTRRRWNKRGGGGGGAVENRGKFLASNANMTKILPPADCLFKTYEFNPNESYERSVAIYSYAHSNLTHGRFLSISPSTGQVRSYRKPFSNLHHHHHVKITQVPIRYLKDMVTVTRFGRGFEFNNRVRQCIIHLLECPNHQEKISRQRKPREDRGGGAAVAGDSILPQDGENQYHRKHHHHRSRRHNYHFYKIIQRCKHRAERTDKPPKCVKSSSAPANKRRLLRRSRRRRKVVFRSRRD